MTHTVAIILTTMNAAGSTSDALVLLVVGMLVVFVSLSLLALLVVLIGRVADAGTTPEPAVTTVANDPAAGDDPVVIAAAVAAVLGPRAKVRRIVMLGREAGRPWITEGRAIIMGAHHPHR